MLGSPNHMTLSGRMGGRKGEIEFFRNVMRRGDFQTCAEVGQVSDGAINQAGLLIDNNPGGSGHLRTLALTTLFHVICAPTILLVQHFTYQLCKLRSLECVKILTIYSLRLAGSIQAFRWHPLLFPRSRWIVSL
jgi:hypothetical protein